MFNYVEIINKNISNNCLGHLNEVSHGAKHHRIVPNWPKLPSANPSLAILAASWDEFRILRNIQKLWVHDTHNSPLVWIPNGYGTYAPQAPSQSSTASPPWSTFDKSQDLRSGWKCDQSCEGLFCKDMAMFLRKWLLTQESVRIVSKRFFFGSAVQCCSCCTHESLSNLWDTLIQLPLFRNKNPQSPIPYHFFAAEESLC